MQRDEMETGPGVPQEITVSDVVGMEWLARHEAASLRRNAVGPHSLAGDHREGSMSSQWGDDGYLIGSGAKPPEVKMETTGEVVSLTREQFEALGQRQVEKTGFFFALGVVLMFALLGSLGVWVVATMLLWATEAVQELISVW